MSDSPLLVRVDFDDDGDFDKGTNDVTDYLDGEQAIVWDQGKNTNRRFAPAEAGQFDTVLYDPASRFSAWNPGSDLAGKLDPGHLVQIQTKPTPATGFLFADGTGFMFADGTGMMFSGVAGRVVGTFISDGFEAGTDWKSPQTPLRGFGVLTRLVNTVVSTTLLQNISISDAINLILDKIEWPADKRIIEEALTTLAWFCLDNADGRQTIEKLVLTEGPGSLWGEDADGNFVFRNRDYLGTSPRATMPQFYFLDTDFRVTNLLPARNLRDVIKACRVIVEDKAPGPMGEIWNHEGDLVLGPNEESMIEIRAGGIFLNAQVPSDVASNTIIKLTGSQEITSGTYKIEYLGQITAALNWNDSGATVGAAFAALSTVGALNASGSGANLNTGIFIELTGVFAGKDIQTLPTIVESTLNPIEVPATINAKPVLDGTALIGERQMFEATGELVSGDFDFLFSSVSAGDAGASGMAYNSSAAAIEAAIIASNALYSNTHCDGGPINVAPVNIILADILENIDLATITPNSLMMETPSATVNVEKSQEGGKPDFVIAAGGIDINELSETSGAAVMWHVKATGAGLTLTSPRIRGQILETVRSQQITFPQSTSLPQSKIDKPDVFTEISAADALIMCEGRVNFYFNPRDSGIVLYEAHTDEPEVVDTIFAVIQGDMIALVNAHSGINKNASITRLKYEYNPGRFMVRVYVGWEAA